ncbi:lactaldehyde reductase [Dysgonomonas macrotermitis]|uniref:Lactaldehyde reductase n=1 Tax=Dysgonomonas macrotermitis TaxID=1346286 RepID=A0A1M4VRE5_9BACT|nr:lactaldehyde reductase [Dysgonomonas macrotermitis]SHE71445.1 lactaldehyde reductase [Dysgonomonas macrotermitis]
MSNRIVLNEISYHGVGSRKEITTEVKRRNLKKALLVTDKDLIKYGVAKLIEDVLNENNIPYEIYDNVKANPTIQNVQLGVDTYKASGADFIVALGGGSAIDTAKGIGIVANNPEHYDIRSLEGAVETRYKSVPVIALPTTAGTAAEVTINYVITDEEQKKKMVCVDPNDIPVVAIIDSELMYSMPKGLTAATGMDALTHAIESLITPGAWEMSDMFEIKAIELIHKHLKNAVDMPNNKEAREGMSLAQYIAGMGFSNVGLGIVHSMAHPLGAFYDTPHGVANALLLPYVMEYNAESPAAEKYKLIAKAMGVSQTENMTTSEGVNAAINAVKTLSKSINIPQKLNEIGVRKEDISDLAVAAFNDVCTGGNPRPTPVEDIDKLYHIAY